MDKRLLLVGISVLVWAPLSAAMNPLVPTASAATTLPASPSVKPPAPASPMPAKLALPSYELYTYYGDRYRDPFIPLIGQMFSDKSVDRPPQTASLLLKGIIEDAHGRMALLASGVSTYILKGGRLYDSHNKMVKGMSGVIKANSVVVIGADHTVRELKVKVPTL
jgi:hypothetical protein